MKFQLYLWQKWITSLESLKKNVYRLFKTFFLFLNTSLDTNVENVFLGYSFRAILTHFDSLKQL